ncbi:MAG: hypothetical protein IJS71_00870 [Clostridia bacterium]|nr:hypothetical protein [Clostridia bacterium]
MKKFVYLFVLAAALFAIGFVFTPVTSFAAITAQPQSDVYPEGAVASYLCESDAEGAEYNWFVEYEGVEYDLNSPDIMTFPWIAYAGEEFGAPSGKLLFFGGIEKGLDGAYVFCRVKEGGKEISSQKAQIKVVDKDYPNMFGIKQPKDVTANAGDTVTVTCELENKAEDTMYKYSLSRLSNEEDLLLETNLDGNFELEYHSNGSYTYYFTVEATKDGKTSVAQSSIFTVTVFEPHPTPEETTEEPTSSPTEEPTEEPTPGASEEPSPEITEKPTEAPSNEKNPGLEKIAFVVLLIGIAVLLVAVVALFVVIIKRKK